MPIPLIRDMTEKEIEEGDMPILSYRLTHWGLLIENKRQDSLFLWIDESIALLKQLE